MLSTPTTTFIIPFCRDLENAVSELRAKNTGASDKDAVGSYEYVQNAELFE